MQTSENFTDIGLLYFIKFVTADGGRPLQFAAQSQFDLIADNAKYYWHLIEEKATRALIEPIRSICGLSRIYLSEFESALPSAHFFDVVYLEDTKVVGDSTKVTYPLTDSRHLCPKCQEIAKARRDYNIEIAAIDAMFKKYRP